MSREIHYSDPYTVKSNPKQNQNQSSPQNPELAKDLILEFR